MLTEELMVGFLLGLVGSSVGGLISHFLTKSRRDEEEFARAYAEFKIAFLPEIIYLKHNANIGRGGSSSDLGEYLYSGYLRHLEAFTIFKSILSKRQIAKITTAWENYCHTNDNTNELNFAQYSYKSNGKTKKDISHFKALALKNINNVLNAIK